MTEPHRVQEISVLIEKPVDHRGHSPAFESMATAWNSFGIGFRILTVLPVWAILTCQATTRPGADPIAVV